MRRDLHSCASASHTIAISVYVDAGSAVVCLIAWSCNPAMELGLDFAVYGVWPCRPRYFR